MSMQHAKGAQMYTAEERADAHDFMTRPLRWPRFPTLPVKRSVGGQMEVGTINYWMCPEIEDGRNVWVVFASMYELRGMSVSDAKSKFDWQVYPTTDDLFYDGWRID